MSEPKTVKLRTPVRIGEEGDLVEELTFRPPRGKDIRRLRRRDGEEFDLLLTLAGKLSGQLPALIDELEGDDLMEVIEIVSGFIKGGQPAGATPSD